MAGFQVVLIATPSPGTSASAVPTIAVPRYASRAARMLLAPWRVLREALRLRAQIYHLHDPELIPVGVVLKLLGARVIYDAHEDIAAQVLGKHWIAGWARGTVAFLSRQLESIADHAFDGIVVVTEDSIRRFRRCPRVALVRNFPKWRVFAAGDVPYLEREPVVIYTGTMSAARGLLHMIEAISRVDVPGVRLVLAGLMSSALRADASKTAGWDRVELVGWQSEEQIRNLLSRGRIGLAVLHPLPNYLNSYPTKLFEYMAAGLPAVASNFPAWRAIVEGADAGIVVNPLAVDEIASAIERLLSSPRDAAAMGARGRGVVATRFNWDREAETLVSLYRSILSDEPFTYAPQHGNDAGQRRSSSDKSV